MVTRVKPNNSGTAFWDSAVSEWSLRTTRHFLEWLEDRKKKSQSSILRRPIADLDGWIVDGASGNLSHRSGKFFTVEGIDVRTNFGPTPRWSQPIINQP